MGNGTATDDTMKRKLEEKDVSFTGKEKTVRVGESDLDARSSCDHAEEQSSPEFTKQAGSYSALDSYVTPTMDGVESSPKDIFAELCKDADEAAYIEKLKTCSLKSVTEDILVRTHQELFASKSGSAEDPRSLSKDTLRRIMQFKLARGTFRPALMKLIEQNGDDNVRRVTKEANAPLYSTINEETLKVSLDKLCELRGVGAATASLILTIEHPSVPFMSDEAAGFFQESLGDIKYTIPFYMRYRRAMLTFLEESMASVTSRELEQRLWTRFKTFKQDKQDGKKSKKLS